MPYHLLITLPHKTKASYLGGSMAVTRARRLLNLTLSLMALENLNSKHTQLCPCPRVVQEVPTFRDFWYQKGITKLGDHKF